MDEHPPKPGRLLAALACAGLVAALVLGGWLPRWWLHYQDASFATGFEVLPLRMGLEQYGVRGNLLLGIILQVVLGAWILTAFAVATLGRSARAYRALHLAFVGCYLLLLVQALGLFSYALAARQGYALANDLDPEKRTTLIVELFLTNWTWLYLGVYLLLVALHVLATTGPAYAAYGLSVSAERPAPGDRCIEHLRSFGEDELFTQSVYASTAIHLSLIFLPLLVLGVYCVDPVDAPPGSGTPTTPPTTAQKVVKKKKITVTIDSPYIIGVPDPEISKVMKEIDKISENVYQASAAGAPGALGRGGGDTGGFGGPPGGKLRFIRVSFRCSNWDDGLNASTGNADRNFLSWYKNLPSVNFEVAEQGEHHPIGALAAYPRGREPQFVYMTGDSQGRITSRETRILKRYLEHGGMLFVDAGSRSFDRWFRSWVRNLTGGRSLKRISKDDEIFRIPYDFPEGIDPLYQHGPPYAMGYKLRDHWSIFYHPGDMNDCWKDNAHKIRKRIRDNAKQIAYNVIYYAIVHYMDDNEKYLKK